MISSSRSAIEPHCISRHGILALAFRHNCVRWNLFFQPGWPGRPVRPSQLIGADKARAARPGASGPGLAAAH
jgi:hypothetical protein